LTSAPSKTSRIFWRRGWLRASRRTSLFLWFFELPLACGAERCVSASAGSISIRTCVFRPKNVPAVSARRSVASFPLTSS